MNDANGCKIGLSDGVDLEFVYSDTDGTQNEIAELYSYTEFPEFQLNVKSFEEQMEIYKLPPSWQKLEHEQRKSIVMKLMDQLDVSKRQFRMQAARCILYLAQGCWAEVQSDEEQLKSAKDNILLLYDYGVFSAFVELLNLEIENTISDNGMLKVAVSLADSMDLRVILSVLYIITETMRAEKESGNEDYIETYDNFVNEINNPYGDELLSVKLLGMITRFCSGTAPHFPMKKVLLLLWKVSLVSLGGMEVLKKLKNEHRTRYNLPETKEDTLEITKCMRASSPPTTAADILDNQNQKRNAFRRIRTNEVLQENLLKQSSFDDQEQLSMEMESQSNDAEEDLSDYYRPFDDPALNSSAPGPAGQRYDQQSYNVYPIRNITRLPWAPKVRQKDIDQFLDISRNKFIGYTLIDDHESLAGLPQPIHEGIKTLKRYMYTSLADVQIKKEEEITRNPISTTEEIQMTPSEILYQAILPNLPQYMIALLKILLAASPTSKSKAESINIMADVLPKEMPMTVTQSTKLGIDVNRHKEIIVKAVSAILLLYLKHFKINHIYQFEFMSQHLVFANCIPLVLKFFNQNIMEYIGSKNAIPIMDFPSSVIGEQPELTSDSLVIGDSAPYSWRNVFSCINLLRILNKLIKWKHSRVMMLVVFKSAPILKKTLKVRHAMMQLYVLKLLKMQTKYLGRQWRKANMKTISAIYAKVRHRLNDDWAFGNDLESRPWDFQAEECTLRTCVDRFNNRRYPEAMQKCQTSITGTNNGTANNAQGNNGSSIGRQNGGNGGNTNCGGNNVGSINSGNGETNDGDIHDNYDNDISLNTNGNGNNNGSNVIGNNSYGYNYYGANISNNGFGNEYSLGYGEWDKKIELTEDFKANYELWLQDVFSQQIDWDALLDNNIDIRYCEKKNKTWEKERRDRLNKSFDNLAKLLPNYDPSVSWTKAEIIQKSIAHIQHLKQRTEKYLATKDPEILKNYKEFKEALKFYQIRNGQLSDLLKKAKITLPPFDLPKFFTNNPSIYEEIKNFENDIKEANNDISKGNDRNCTRINIEKKSKGKKENITLNLEGEIKNKTTGNSEITKEIAFPEIQIDKNITINKEKSKKDFENSTIVTETVLKPKPLTVESKITTPLISCSNITDTTTVTSSANDENISKTLSSTVSTVESASNCTLNTTLTSSFNSTKKATSTLSVDDNIISNVPSPKLQKNETEINKISTISPSSTDLQNLPLIIKTPLNVLQQSNPLVLPATSLSVPFITLPPGSVPTIIKFENILSSSAKKIKLEEMKTDPESQTGIKTIKILPQPTVKLYYPNADGKIPIPALTKKIIIKNRKVRKKRKNEEIRNTLQNDKKLKFHNNEQIKDNKQANGLESDDVKNKLTDPVSQLFNEDATAKLLNEKTNASAEYICNNENQKKSENINDSIEDKLISSENDKIDPSQMKLPNVNTHIRTVSPTAAFLKSFPKVASQSKVIEDKQILPVETTCSEFLNKKQEKTKKEGVVLETCMKNVKIPHEKAQTSNDINVLSEQVSNINHNNKVTLENVIESTEIGNNIVNSDKIVTAKINENVIPIQDVKNEKSLKQIEKPDFSTKLSTSNNEPHLYIVTTTVTLQNSSEISKIVTTSTTKSTTIFSPYFDKPTQNTFNKKNSISLSSLNLSTQVPICTPLPLESLQSKGKNELKSSKTSFNFSIPSITSNLISSSKSLNELPVDKNKNESIFSSKKIESNINTANEEKQSNNSIEESKNNQDNIISESQKISESCSGSQLFTYPPLTLPNMWNTIPKSSSLSVTKSPHSSYTAPFYLNSLPIFNSDIKNSVPSCSESIKDTVPKFPLTTTGILSPPSIITTTSSKHNSKCFVSSNNLLPATSTSAKDILNNSTLSSSSSSLLNSGLNCANEKQFTSANISISENNQLSHSINSYPVFTFSLTSNTQQPCADILNFSSTQNTKSVSMYSNTISSSTSAPTYIGNSKASNFELTGFPALSNTKLQTESSVVSNKVIERNSLPESKFIPTSVFNTFTESYFNGSSTLPLSTKDNSLVNVSEYYTNKISSAPLIPLDSSISVKETLKEKGDIKSIPTLTSTNSDKKVTAAESKTPISINCTSSLITNSSYTYNSHWTSPSTTSTNSKSNTLENEKTKSEFTPSSNASAEISIKVSQNTTSLAKINPSSDLNSLKNSNYTSNNTTTNLPLNTFNSYKIGYTGDSVENSSLISNNFPQFSCANAPPWSSNLLQNNRSNNYINYDIPGSYSGFNYNSSYLAQNTEHQSQIYSSDSSMKQNTSNTFTNNYLNVDPKNECKEKNIYSASNLFKTKLKDSKNESLDTNIAPRSQQNQVVQKSNKVVNTENIIANLNYNNANPGFSSSGKSEKSQDQINKNTLTKPIVSSTCNTAQNNFSKLIYKESSNSFNISENNFQSVGNTAVTENIFKPLQNNLSTISSSNAKNVANIVGKTTATTQQIPVTTNSIHSDTKNNVLSTKSNISISNQNSSLENVSNIGKNNIKPLNKSNDVQNGSLEYLSKVNNQKRTLNQSTLDKDSYDLQAANKNIRTFNSTVKTTEVTTIAGQINNFNLPAIKTFASQESTNNYKLYSSQKMKSTISSNNNSHNHSLFYDIASNSALSTSMDKNLITNSVQSSSCSNPKQHVNSISSNSNNLDSNNYSSSNNCVFYSNTKNYYYPLQGENSVPYNSYSMSTGIGHSNSYNSDSRNTSLISYPNIKSDLPWITPPIPPTTLSTTDYNTFTFSLTPTTNSYVTTASQYSATSFSFSLTTPKSSTSTTSASTNNKLKCYSSKNSFSNQGSYSHEFDSNFNTTKYQTTEPTNFQFSLQKPSNNKVDNNFLINNVEKTNYNFSIDSQLNSKTEINQTNMTPISNNEFKIPNSVTKLKNKTSSTSKSDKRSTDNQKGYYDCDQNKPTMPTIKTSQKNTVNWMTSGSDSITSSITSHYNSSIFGDCSTNQQNNLTHNGTNNQDTEKKSNYYPPIDENIVTWSPNKLLDQSMNNYSQQHFYGNTNDYQVTNNFVPQSHYQSNSSCKQIKTEKNTTKEQNNSNFFSIKQFVDQTSSSIPDQNTQKYYSNYQNLQTQDEQNLDINQRISQNQTHSQQNQSLSNKIQLTNNQKKISPIKLKDHNRKDVSKTNTQNINNFIESTTTNLNHNQPQQQQQQQSQLQSQQQPHQEQQETSQKSGQLLLCNYSAESLISKKDKFSKNLLSNYNSSFDTTNLYSSHCNPIGQHTDLIEQQNYSSNYFPSYSSTNNNNNNHNFISEVDYLGANIFNSTESNTDTFNKLNSTSFLKDSKKSNSISNYTSAHNISHFPSHPHHHSSTYESNYLPVPPLVSSVTGNENCDSTYPFNNNSTINNHNQSEVTSNNYSNYSNWNSTSKQYMIGSQNNNNNNNNNVNAIGSQYTQQISSNSNMNQSEQTQINSQSSSVGTNLPNFNLSSICPEINDKVCPNNNIW